MAASALPTARAASPPTPASTSSNTSVGGAADSTRRVASIARASSPPDATFASGRAGSPAFAPRRNSTSAPVGAVADAHLEAGARAGQARAGAPRPPLRASAPPPVAADPSRSSARRRASIKARRSLPEDLASPLRPSPAQRGGRARSARTRGRPPAGGRTCVAARRTAGGARRTAARRSGSSSKRSPRSRSSRATSSSSACDGAEALGEIGERGRGADRWEKAPASRSTASARASCLRGVGSRQRRARFGDRGPAARPIRPSTASSPASSLVLVERRDRRRCDLVDLEAEQVDAAGELAVVTAELGEARPRCPASSRRASTTGSRSTPAKRSSAVALGRLAQQRLVGMLAVEVDEVVTELGQRRRRRHPAVDVGARSAASSGPSARARARRSPRRKRPSTTASSAPARTTAGSARPPRSSSRASTTSVLPAPVSPVRAVMPVPTTRSRSAMTPRSRTCSSSSTRGLSDRSTRSGHGALHGSPGHRS